MSFFFILKNSKKKAHDVIDVFSVGKSKKRNKEREKEKKVNVEKSAFVYI